jgi:hypothetical protein
LDLGGGDTWKVYAHLAKYYRQFAEAPPDSKTFDDPSLVVAFTPISGIEKALARQLAAIDFEAIARKTVEEHLDRLAGRV